MKTLEMDKMEQIEGGLECDTGLGLATTLAVGGLALAASGGLAAVAVGAALWEGGVAAAATAECF